MQADWKNLRLLLPVELFNCNTLFSSVLPLLLVHMVEQQVLLDEIMVLSKYGIFYAFIPNTSGHKERIPEAARCSVCLGGGGTPRSQLKAPHQV
jgi:hypothetical protein